MINKNFWLTGSAFVLTIVAVIVFLILIKVAEEKRWFGEENLPESSPASFSTS